MVKNFRGGQNKGRNNFNRPRGNRTGNNSFRKPSGNGGPRRNNGGGFQGRNNRPVGGGKINTRVSENRRPFNKNRNNQRGKNKNLEGSHLDKDLEAYWGKDEVKKVTFNRNKERSLDDDLDSYWDNDKKPKGNQGALVKEVLASAGKPEENKIVESDL